MLVKNIQDLDKILNLSPSERFLSVRNISDNTNATAIILPREINFSLKDEKEMMVLFNTAENLWNDMFNKNAFERTITQLVSNPSLYNDSVHEQLKLTRIGGIVLRDSYRLFSYNHKNIVSFYEFMKLLGVFNDEYGTDRQLSKVQGLLEIYRKYIEECNQEAFVACSNGSYLEYVKETVDLISGYLAKSKLSIEELHDLRRTCRRILNLLLLKVIGEADATSCTLYIYLRQVNTSLGDLLDLVRIESYPPSKPVSIPSDSDFLLTEFLHKIRWS